MHKSFKIIGILAGLGVLAVIVMIAIMLWIDRWAITKERAKYLATTSESSTPTIIQTVSWIAFSQNISVSYEPSLATYVETSTVPAVLPDNQSLFSSWHPDYAQIRFLGFPAESAYQLPFIDPENNRPQIMVFQTKDFPGFGDKHPQGFVNQLRSLTKFLKIGVSPNQCEKPTPDYESALPFLPWVNMKQTFCAQPQIIGFSNGKGIRYVTYYAQSPEPVLEQRVFYTFQGVTNDGTFYVSALFPVETGSFPKSHRLVQSVATQTTTRSLNGTHCLQNN